MSPSQQDPGPRPFMSPRTLRAMVTLSLLSFAGAIILGVFGGDWFESSVDESTDQSAYSVSAVGHEALTELLRARGHSVVLSRQRMPQALSPDGLLIIAEPDLSVLAEMELEDDLYSDYGAPPLLKRIRRAGARQALVVLPKWTPEGYMRQRWNKRVRPVEPREVTRTLETLGVERAAPVRLAEVSAWSVTGPLDGRLSDGPALRYPQLMAAHTEITPWLADPQGVLVGSLQDDELEIVVLADPDLIANHGLWRPGHGESAVALIEALAAGGPIIFDEAVHGYEQRSSLWAALFRFPLSLFMVQLAFIALIVLWAGLGRFGAPEPLPSKAAAGRLLLIQHTGELLRFGGHSGYTLRRYWRRTVWRLAQTLGGPEGAESAEADHAARLQWLTALIAKRDLRLDPMALEAQVRQLEARGNPRHVVSAALKIHSARRQLLGAQHERRA